MSQSYICISGTLKTYNTTRYVPMTQNNQKWLHYYKKIQVQGLLQKSSTSFSQAI